MTVSSRSVLTNLRSWGGERTTTLAFPIAALVAAILVFATTAPSVGAVLGILVSLVPWALHAGEARVGPWLMIVVGIGAPGVVVLSYDATGATFLALLAVAWIAARGTSLVAEVGAVAATVAIPIAHTVGSPKGWQSWVYFATGVLFAWFVGRVLCRERQLVAALADAQHQLHAAGASAERHRIAREVHDIVGHSLTVVLLNVIGARRNIFRDPAAAAEALDRAEQAGRSSLDSVRTTVGLLRDPDQHDRELLPMPGAADILPLVSTAAAAGMGIRVEVDGDLDDVDDYAGLAAFRLVQEAISNVEHHAPMSDVAVQITNDGDNLTVSVRNDGAEAVKTSRSHGTGLTGLQERLAAVGGTMSAGPVDGGWSVEGWIPLHRAATSATG